MPEDFFRRLILNSPCDYPTCHWELRLGWSLQNVAPSRRRTDFVTPIPKPNGPKASRGDLHLDEVRGVYTPSQRYDLTSIINQVRGALASWGKLPEGSWLTVPRAARILTHSHHHDFGADMHILCHVEPVETATWPRECGGQSQCGKGTAVTSCRREPRGQSRVEPPDAEGRQRRGKDNRHVHAGCLLNLRHSAQLRPLPSRPLPSDRCAGDCYQGVSARAEAERSVQLPPRPPTGAIALDPA